MFRVKTSKGWRPVNTNNRIVQRRFLDGQVVASTTTEGVPSGKKTAEVIKWGEEITRKVVPDGIVDTQIGIVRVDDKSIYESISGHGMTRAKVASIKIIPQALKAAMLLEGPNPLKPGWILGAPVKINGMRFVFIAVIRENQQSKHLYVHEAFFQGDIREASPKTDASDSSAHLTDTPRTIKSVLELIYGVKLDRTRKRKHSLGKSIFGGPMRLMVNELRIDKALRAGLIRESGGKYLMRLIIKARRVEDPPQLDLFGGGADAPLQPKKAWVRHHKTGKMFQRTVYVRTDKNEAIGRQIGKEQAQSDVRSAIGRLKAEGARIPHIYFQVTDGQMKRLIHPSTRTPGKVQVTDFNGNDIPTGHDEYDSFEDAVARYFTGLDHPVSILARNDNGGHSIWEEATFESPFSDQLADMKYAYVSPMRPLSGVQVDGRTARTLDGRKGVLYRDEPLPIEKMKSLSLYPVTPGAKRAFAEELVKQEASREGK